MVADNIEKILEEVKAGNLQVEDVAHMLRQEAYADLGYAKVDLNRKQRRGNTEVIYGAGKTVDQIAGIADSLVGHGQGNILITRLDNEKGNALGMHFDKAGICFSYNDVSRIGVVGRNKEPDGIGSIAVVTGGTSDMPVAEEAAQTAEFLGNKVIRMYDVGVAGLHRLLSGLEELDSAQVVIAIAGMEGALASVVGGLVSVPVIAVPTSVGYGASFEGLAALLSMINSCASGVTVVNIDNGYGAAYQASMINHINI